MPVVEVAASHFKGRGRDGDSPRTDPYVRNYRIRLPPQVMTRSVDADSLNLDDPVNAAFWNDAALRRATETTLAPAQVGADAYAAIFYTGGHATM